MRYSREWAFNKVKQHWIKAVGAVFLLFLLSVIFGTTVQRVFFIIVFIALGSMSTFYFNYVQVPIKFELIKLFTIMTGAVYGVVPALIVGISSVILGKVLISRIDERLFISVSIMAVVAILSALFVTPETIAVSGLILAGLYNVVVFTMSMLMGGDLLWNIPYEGSDFAINFVLFTSVAPVLVLIL